MALLAFNYAPLPAGSETYTVTSYKKARAALWDASPSERDTRGFNGIHAIFDISWMRDTKMQFN